jgi:hypothetical protein
MLADKDKMKNKVSEIAHNKSVQRHTEESENDS